MKRIAITIFSAGRLTAQIVSGNAAEPNKLAFVIPALYEQAIQESPAILQSAIRSAIAPNSVSLNASAAVHLSNLPIPSPAANFIIVDRKGTNTGQRILLSLGPVLAERWQTIGADNFAFALTNQTFSFDRLDDLDLRGFQASYPIGAAGVELGVDASVNLLLTQTAAHFTWGATDKVDVSYSFSLVTSSLLMQAGAVLGGGGQSMPLASRFIGASAAGLGDGTIRVKTQLINRSRRMRDVRPFSAGLAFATDIRLPTGDELNYHGTGTYGIKPFIIASATIGRLTPHLNGGYQYNGVSLLGSQYANKKGQLPGIWFYSLGLDAGMSKRVTLATEVINNIVVSGQRAFLRPNPEGAASRPRIHFEDKTRQEISAGIGLKVLLPRNLILTINTLMRLNTAGLRARVVPLVGLSYILEN